jgi:GT2 family glycosyltransferase/glycosyltransferase involved in cell wall biosynthesis
MSEPDPVLEATKRGQLAGLPRRVWLTYRYHGPRVLARRVLTFPLRFTPWATRLRLGGPTIDRRAQARSWFATGARPVTVVIPSFGSAREVRRVVRSVRRTTPRELVRIVVADDAGPAEELATMRRIHGIELIAGERNLGFAGNANRGLARADPGADVVLLNADVVTHPGWLECLQYAAYAEGSDVGIVGARLLYGNGQIQHAGMERNEHAPEWFDHRFRFAPADHGPADVPEPVLAVTGACMYVKRAVIDEIGLLDPEYPMAYEDVDWCLRAWEAGHSVVYEPAAILDHAESTTRSREPGPRELRSQERFRERWEPFFAARDVRAEGDKLRIVYVTERTDVGGGHRLVFEDINRLHDRGHEVSLFTLEPPPDWFDLRAPVRMFADYDELARALAPLHAIKVATWWRTAPHVWRASVVAGIPIYFVQDIETTYYPDGESARHRVLAGYRSEFHYLTTSTWNRDRLRELGHEAGLVVPGLDLGTLRPLGTPRRDGVVLAIGRSNRLKRFDLTVAAWRELSQPRPQLQLFGVEPEVAPPGAEYVLAPSDGRVNELLNECSVFVQTSSHEGFALPPLEAMAAGAAVVCTDADGNRDYCRDGVNCLMPAPEPRAIAAAIERVLSDPDLGARLGKAGLETASHYGVERRAGRLESYLRGVATGSPPRAVPRA